MQVFVGAIGATVCQIQQYERIAEVHWFQMAQKVHIQDEIGDNAFAFYVPEKSLTLQLARAIPNSTRRLRAPRLAKPTIMARMEDRQERQRE